MQLLMLSLINIHAALVLDCAMAYGIIFLKRLVYYHARSSCCESPTLYHTHNIS